MDAILILGAAMWSDGPSPALRRRTEHAVAQWRKQPSQWLLPCGGLGKNGPTEGQAIQILLIDAGVTPDRIIPECHSTNTYENIKFAAPLLRLIGAKSVLIVTDEYHRHRALTVARHFGINAVTSSPTVNFRNPTTKTKLLIRESLARTYYRAKLLKSRKGGQNL